MVRQLMRRAQRADRAAYEKARTADRAAHEKARTADRAAHEKARTADRAAHKKTLEAALADVEKRWNQKLEAANQKRENLERAFRSITSRDFMKNMANRFRAYYRENKTGEHGKRLMDIMHGARLLMF